MFDGVMDAHGQPQPTLNPLKLPPAPSVRQFASQAEADAQYQRLSPGKYHPATIKTNPLILPPPPPGKRRGSLAVANAQYQRLSPGKYHPSETKKAP